MRRLKYPSLASIQTVWRQHTTERVFRAIAPALDVLAPIDEGSEWFSVHLSRPRPLSDGVTVERANRCTNRMRAGMASRRAARMRALLAISGSASQVSGGWLAVACRRTVSIDAQTDRRLDARKLYVEPVSDVTWPPSDRIVGKNVDFSHARGNVAATRMS